MPTKYPRILVTRDPELADALERVGQILRGRPAATLVRDLAIRGAEAVLSDDARRKEALERLAEWSTKRTGPIDWDLLGRIDREAWGYEGDDG